MEDTPIGSNKLVRYLYQATRYEVNESTKMKKTQQSTIEAHEMETRELQKIRMMSGFQDIIVEIKDGVSIFTTPVKLFP
jgi:hypothetical protein